MSWRIVTRRSKRGELARTLASISDYEPDIMNPRSFNEKVQWMKLNHHDSLMTRCADKVSVRDYVRERIGERYLVPSLGVWSSATGIDFASLPHRYVLKVNYGSGTNVICDGRGAFDVDDVRSRLAEWMEPRWNHYLYSYEWAYKDIQPLILGEAYLEDPSGDPPDYKFFCFGGEPRAIQVTVGRRVSRADAYMDPDWNQLPFGRYVPIPEVLPEAPATLKEMVRLARILAQPFSMVRVDFYEHDGQVKFGELTFYPGNGTEPFRPADADFEMGSWWDLPAVRRRTPYFEVLRHSGHVPRVEGQFPRKLRAGVGRVRRILVRVPGVRAVARHARGLSK